MLNNISNNSNNIMIKLIIMNDYVYILLNYYNNLYVYILFVLLCLILIMFNTY